MKDLVIIGGPNGAGKTTAGHRLLPDGLNIREFVDADAIARGLSPLNPEGSAVLAGRLMSGAFALWRLPVTASLLKRLARDIRICGCCNSAGISAIA